MPESPAKPRIPLLGIVGKPNVGKSTIFNRLNRLAPFHRWGDEPVSPATGLVRGDHLERPAGAHRRYRGILPDEKELIPSEIFRQACVVLEEADAIILVADVRSALTSPDIELARHLRRLSKPLFLAANRVDSAKQEAEAENMRTLGIERLFADFSRIRPRNHRTAIELHAGDSTMTAKLYNLDKLRHSEHSGGKR